MARYELSSRKSRAEKRGSLCLIAPPETQVSLRFQSIGEQIAVALRFVFSAHLESAASEACMNGIIYLIGLIVVIMAILSFLGLR